MMNVRAATVAVAFFVLVIALVPSEAIFNKRGTICPANGAMEVKGCLYKCPSEVGFGKYKDNVRCTPPNNAGSPTRGVCYNGLCLAINGELEDYPFPKECIVKNRF
uniref:Putative secreted protein n=1 Tax=Ixodes scapularis TaxID=6945 RepID=A0A4D5S4X6_IXOSC